YNNEILTDFNGILYPSVFDKEKIITTLANDEKSVPMQFDVREDLIYKGKASITDGRFSFEFRVPKDITYSYGNGKIIYYAGNDTTDASGYFNAIVVGGTSINITNDTEGPEINLYLNDNEFSNTGIASPNPLIYAEIADESGINTVGNGIGHDITGILDNNTTNPIVLNDYFESNLNDYTSGILRYPMSNLGEGWHDLQVKVWDVYNNSSLATLRFRVVGENSIIIANVGNYPNPASDFTRFTFEHNKAGESLTVEIFVYDLAGKLVASFNENIITDGFNTTLPEWPLTDLYGNKLRQGIYPYRVTLTDTEGRKTHSHQKLVVIRQ
ncbi:MAG: T9SS type A sorting domain-containing protein, partial [Bacteroidales bacterium]|nr:T9SS type A sorting domain-containing protein [Bacteroidales bacterium]